MLHFLLVFLMIASGTKVDDITSIASSEESSGESSGSAEGSASTLCSLYPGCGMTRAGKRNRIVGGSETEKNEYPWQVGLVGVDEKAPFCGGVILSTKTILTAAHCTWELEKEDFKVVIAEHDTTKDDGQEMIEVCEKLEHPDYEKDTEDNDFSLLTLCKPVRFRSGAWPICLPEQDGSAYINKVATVAGWGLTSDGGDKADVLLDVNVTTIDNDKCNEYHGGWIFDTMMCARGKGVDSCQGDSGGPLITLEPPHYHYFSVIGVVSWGDVCADPNFPGVYARVTKVVTWIMKNMEGETCDPPKYYAKTSTNRKSGERSSEQKNCMRSAVLKCRGMKSKARRKCRRRARKSCKN